MAAIDKRHVKKSDGAFDRADASSAGAPAIFNVGLEASRQ